MFTFIMTYLIECKVEALYSSNSKVITKTTGGIIIAVKIIAIKKLSSIVQLVYYLIHNLGKIFTIIFSIFLLLSFVSY